MAQDQEVQGTVDKGVGKAKEAWGNVTGDSQTKAEGQMQQAEGDARQTVGHAQRKAQDAGDQIGDAAEHAGDAARTKMDDVSHR